MGHHGAESLYHHVVVTSLLIHTDRTDQFRRMDNQFALDFVTGNDYTLHLSVDQLMSIYQVLHLAAPVPACAGVSRLNRLCESRGAIAYSDKQS